MAAVNVTLLAFAAECNLLLCAMLLLGAGHAAIDPACWMPDSFIDPVLHIVRAVSIKNLTKMLPKQLLYNTTMLTTKDCKQDKSHTSAQTSIHFTHSLYVYAHAIGFPHSELGRC